MKLDPAKHNMFDTIQISQKEAMMRCPTECVQKTFANTLKKIKKSSELVLMPC